MMTPNRLTRELDARLDGPHADEHTAGAASLAAECIRFLNYATGSHRAAGLEFPSTVYEVAADLKLAAERMPQLLAQLDQWLADQQLAGHLGMDDGSPTYDALARAGVSLTIAASHARALADRLGEVQNALAAVNGRGPNRPGRAA